MDVEAPRRMPPDRQLGNILRLVSRVVENLYLQQVLGVIHFADGVDQPVGDIHLVENGQLDGDRGQHRERWQWLGGLTPVFHVKINEVVAVPPVDRQNAEDKEIKNENQ